MLFAVILWNFIMFPLCRIWPGLETTLMLRFPAEVSTPLLALLVSMMRAFTYTFIHSGALHLCANMLWLLIFGYSLYPRIGTLRFFSLYFGGGLAGAVTFALLFSLCPEPRASLCGASAAGLAITGASIFLTPRRGLAAIATLLTFAASPSLPSIATHAGGLLTGLAAGLLWKSRASA